MPRASAVLWGLMVLGGCATARESYVRPWFRTLDFERYVLAPHVLEWGGGRAAEIEVDGSWVRLPHGHRSSFVVDPVGDALAVTERLGVDGAYSGNTGVFVYHRGQREPVRLTPATCPSPRISRSPPEITCFACGDDPPRVALDTARRGSCRTLHLARFDPRGTALGHSSLTSSIAEPVIEGRLPSGAWILAEGAHNPDFLFFHGPRARFRVDAAEIVALPYGADPMGRDTDAEGRAREILAEVPIRDRVVAELRAALEEEERAHPERTMLDEVVNRLGRGSALEPRLPVDPRACYEVVVRATPDLTRLTLGLYPDDLHASLASRDTPPLAMRQGTTEIRARHCFADRAPPRLRVRIEGTTGRGYVVARIYRSDGP